MSSRMFQYVYKELVRPLVAPKMRFSSSGTNTSSVGTSKTKPGGNTERTKTILKVFGGFVPGVYIGYVLNDQGAFDSKDKKKDEKDGSKDKANGKDAMDKAKDKLEEAKKKVNGEDGKDAAKDKMEGVKDKAKEAKDKVTGSDDKKND